MSFGVWGRGLGGGVERLVVWCGCGNAGVGMGVLGSGVGWW